MNYTADYTDEKGRVTKVTVTEEESREALRNDYEKLMKTYNPSIVKITRELAQTGEAMRLSIQVNAPTHYLTSQEDRTPKSCSSMTATMVVYPGYPLKGVKVFYPANHYLASPNVFRSGNACIDTWVVFTSSILTVAEKIIMDMIHNPAVTRYNSMANPWMEDWHKDGVEKGLFPTIPPRRVYALLAMPPRKRPKTTTFPPMPPRKRRA